jgi:hypothetical protein
VLPKRTRYKPEKIPEWDLQLTSHELDDVKELLPLVRDLTNKGLTRGIGGKVVMSSPDPADQGPGASDI